MIARLISLLPGGQIIGIGATAIRLLTALVKAIIEGITVCVANPIVFIVVGASFVAGVYEGLRWQRSKMVAARQELARVMEQWKSADAESKARLDKALADADRAEREAREAVNRSKSPPSRRVRPDPSSSPSSGSGLPRVSTVPQSD